jgi:hypothetical protein
MVHKTQVHDEERICMDGMVRQAVTKRFLFDAFL